MKYKKIVRFPSLYFFLVAITASLTLISCSNSSTNKNTIKPVVNDRATNDFRSSQTSVTLTPASTDWKNNNHIHGLAVNSKNPAILYIATHNGLIQRSEQGKWFWMGKERADYMGFTTDPRNSQTFFASGHPHTGGNLGFIKSQNQGQNWQQISMPGVDFHSLTFAVDGQGQEIFYGMAVSGKQGLFLSKDGGQTWSQPKAIGLNDVPFELVANPNQPNQVFATTRGGVYQSNDFGDTWSLVPGTQDAPIISLTLVEKADESIVMYGYRFLKSSEGLYQNTDQGKTWQPLGQGTQGVIIKLAIAGSNPQIIYAANEKNAIFQSQDGGQTWKELP
jgi:hypothetical protein